MNYEITLMTSRGPIKENYTDDPKNDKFETIQEFEIRMKEKHGDFIMLSHRIINI